MKKGMIVVQPRDLISAKLQGKRPAPRTNIRGLRAYRPGNTQSAVVLHISRKIDPKGKNQFA